MRRRTYLLGVTTAVVGLAGCSDSTDDEEEDDDEDDDTEQQDGGAAVGPAEPDAEMPTASFGFEYDTGGPTLAIMHEAGDPIRPSTLSVRGDFDGGEPETTQWNGSTSGSLDDDPAVAAGDVWELGGVGPAYDVRVVWEAGDESATLSADEGPDA